MAAKVLAFPTPAERLARRTFHPSAFGKPRERSILTLDLTNQHSAACTTVMLAELAGRGAWPPHRSD